MEWNPRVNLRSQRILQRDQNELADTLTPGWRGDATRPSTDLLVMLDHLPIGMVGIYPRSKRAMRFLLHEVIGGCENAAHAQPPLGFIDGQGVVICAVPVWSSILNRAVCGGLAIEIAEPPEGSQPLAEWHLEESDP